MWGCFSGGYRPRVFLCKNGSMGIFSLATTTLDAEDTISTRFSVFIYRPLLLPYIVYVKILKKLS